MLLNVITPVTRYGNLFLIEKSLRSIPKESRKWICVFDNTHIPKNIPRTCEAYIHMDKNSVAGNAQRNYALDLIKEGHVYFMDDDTEIHEHLWKYIHSLDKYDFIHFSQVNRDGSLRLKGKDISIENIDRHAFIVSRECIGETRWTIDKCNADDIFAKECYKNSKSPKFISKVLSIYNSLG